MSLSFPDYNDDEVEQLLLFKPPSPADLWMAALDKIMADEKGLVYSWYTIDSLVTLSNDSHIPPSQIKP